MSTPLSLSLPATGTLSVVPTATPAARSTATPVVTEQVAIWTVLGVVTAAVAAGVLEVAFHLAG